MGSFRSQPDLHKHTDINQGVGLTYVSSHMCGNFFDNLRMENLHGGCTSLTVSSQQCKTFALCRIRWPWRYQDFLTQAPKYPNLWKDTSSNNYKGTVTIRRATTRQLWNKLSWEWTSWFFLKVENNKSYRFKNRWDKFKTARSMRRSLMLDAHPMWFWSPLSLFTAQMQVTRGLWLVWRVKLKSLAEIINQKIL